MVLAYPLRSHCNNIIVTISYIIELIFSNTKMIKSFGKKSDEYWFDRIDDLNVEHILILGGITLSAYFFPQSILGFALTCSGIHLAVKYIKLLFKFTIDFFETTNNLRKLP